MDEEGTAPAVHDVLLDLAGVVRDIEQQAEVGRWKKRPKTRRAW
jgi:hypothetical protein